VTKGKATSAGAVLCRRLRPLPRGFRVKAKPCPISRTAHFCTSALERNWMFLRNPTPVEWI